MPRALVGHDLLSHPRRREIDEEWSAKIAKYGAKLMPYFTEMSRVDTGSETGILVQYREGGEAMKVETYRAGADAPASRRLEVLRRFGGDELPQVISVHNGDMVMAGSRLVFNNDLKRYAAVDPKKFAVWQAEVYEAYPKAIIGVGALRRRFDHGDPHNPALDSACMDLELSFFRTVTEKDYIRFIRRTPIEQMRAFLGMQPGRAFNFGETQAAHAPLDELAVQAHAPFSELAASEATF